MASLDSNKVTGVSVVSNATDAASKQYVDNFIGQDIPSTTGNAGNFLSVKIPKNIRRSISNTRCS
jgi:hypothetical protein